jgi:hypothetical protein
MREREALVAAQREAIARGVSLMLPAGVTLAFGPPTAFALRPDDQLEAEDVHVFREEPAK